ncbi:hypothetical protein ACIXLV_18575 [Bacteroides fragilis]
MKSRDTTFDYKKSKVDIASENLDKAKEYAKELQEQAKKVGKELSDELSNAIANVPTLEEALKLAKVKEDVKKSLRSWMNRFTQGSRISLQAPIVSYRPLRAFVM